MPRFALSRRRRAVIAIAAACGSALLGEWSRAINFTLSFDSVNSVNPSYDPTGSQLTTLMNHVAATYEDIFEDAHNITVTFRWADLGGSALASHTLLSQSAGRENSMLIQLDNRIGTGGAERVWFMDPTPADDSEFDMTQQLWRDLSASQRTSFYSGPVNVPDTFEAAYHGPANAFAPASAQNNLDALSALFLNVGHGLGMSATNTSTQTETADSDYDYDGVNIFGATLAAKVDGADIASLVNANTAMNSDGLNIGFRRRPSHTDLLAMAAVHNYTLLDIPRREWYAANSDWNTDANWTGNTIPGSADEVFIRDNNGTLSATLVQANLSSNAFANIVHVSEAANLNLNAHQLTVDTINVDDPDTDLLIPAGGTLSSGALRLHNNSQVLISGSVINSAIVSNEDSEIQDQGTINISSVLVNSGTITALNGTLTINAVGAASLNLDGTMPLGVQPEHGALTVVAVNSDMVINGPLTDPFNGDINVGSSNSLTFNNPWNLGGGTNVFGARDGVLNLNGGTTSATAAALGGATVTVDGDINVGTSNFGLITAPVIFSTDNFGAEVLVNGTLQFDNAVTYQGGSHTSKGRLIWNDDVTIAGNTTIDVAELDFDGFSPLATVTINNGVVLTISSLITDASSGTVDIRGSMIVNGGSWSSDSGTIILNTGTIGGSSLFTNQATMNVLAGVSSITSSSSFAAASNNTLTGALRLVGDATIAGGTWTGSGTLALADQTTTFTGNTTLGVNFDMDGPLAETGTVIVNSGVTVNVTGLIPDNFDATLRVNSGTFNESLPIWFNRGNVILSGTGRVLGQQLTNLGTISGSGTIGVSDLDNRGTISGGNLSTLNISTTNFPDLDGSGAEGGVINAIDGDVHVFGDNGGLFLFNGDLNIGPGRTFTMDSRGLRIDGSGTPGRIDFTGGIYAAPGFDQRSILTVNSGTSALNTGTYVFFASTNTLNANLVLIGAGSINGNAVFSGSGHLVIPLASGCSLASADIGVDIINNGVLFASSGTNHVLSISGTGTTSVPLGTTLNVGSNGPVTQAEFVVSGTADVGSVTVSGLTSVGGFTANLVAGNIRSNQLSIATGGVAKIKANGTSTGTSRLNLLTIAGGPTPFGKLDLDDNDLVVDYTGASVMGSLRLFLRTGYNGGNWNGTGLASTAANHDPLHHTALGSAEASTLLGAGGGTFSGQSVDGTAILVKFTYYGDSDLDGDADGVDIGTWATNFTGELGGTGNRLWTQGDWDYDGDVDGVDAGLWAQAFTGELGGGGLGGVVINDSALDPAPRRSFAFWV